MQSRLAQIFEGATTLDELREAFCFDHTYNGKYFEARATVTIGTENDIEVRGTFRCTNVAPEKAGHFYRRFYRKGANLRVHHAIIYVEEPHRDHDLATVHYGRLLAYYAKIGVGCVEMEANQDGPTVWPGFAFSLSRPDQRDRYEQLLKRELNKYLEPEETLELLKAAKGFTPLQARIRIHPEGHPEPIAVGLVAIRQLYLEYGELPMIAWLTFEAVQVYLAARDILSPELGKENPK